MKANFEAPELELSCFSVEDVITASGLTNGGAGGNDKTGWDQLGN